jgi:prepilin-type N-terminal cleavage/methylation domain-containing protein
MDCSSPDRPHRHAPEPAMTLRGYLSKHPLGFNSGFTLVELMVTVALVAIILGLSATYINSSQYTLRAAAYNLRSALQKTRLEAIKRNRAVYLDFDFNDDGAIDSAFTMWVDLNGNHNYEGTTELLESIQGMSGIAIGSVPTAAGGPGVNDTPSGSGTIPGDGVSLSGDRARFNPDGTATTGTVYLRSASDPNAGTYAIVLDSVGRSRISYFQPGGSWKPR